MDQFLTVDRFRVSYLDQGKGETIIFLHGWMANKNVYGEIISKLSHKYRCISLDLPGFGKSSVIKKTNTKKITEILHKAVKKLGIDSYYLVGNSLGGAISIIYANKYPNEIKKLVLISPFINFSQFPKMTFNLVRYVIPYAIGKKIISPIFKFIKLIVNFHDYKDEDPRKTLAKIKKERIKYRAVSAFKIAYELSSLDLYKLLGRIRKDILFIYGTKDQLLNIKPLEPLFGVLTNIHLAVYQDVRHFLSTYNPGELAKKIDLFFDRSNVKL